jgi:hypothetical protein
VEETEVPSLRPCQISPSATTRTAATKRSLSQPPPPFAAVLAELGAVTMWRVGGGVAELGATILGVGGGVAVRRGVGVGVGVGAGAGGTAGEAPMEAPHSTQKRASLANRVPQPGQNSMTAA